MKKKKKNFRCPYKIWHKFISFDMRKKKGNLRQVIGFMKKKMTLGVLGVSPSISNGVAQPYLDPQSKSPGDPY
jgi:hypothetical protein